MLLSEFCLSAIERIEQGDYGIKPTVRLYTDGYQSSDPAELNFIRSANIKYHNTESDTLIGTYFDISWEHEGLFSPMCRIEAGYLMDTYQSGGWEGVDKVVQSNIDHVRQVDSGIFDHLDEYDRIREHLILRPISFARNRLELKDHACQRFGDIALALYIKVSDDGKNLMSAKVPRNAVAQWNLPQDEVFADALQNTALLYPPRIYLSPLEVINPPYMRGVFMGEGEGRVMRIETRISATLTTTRQLNGAIAMFYPGVKERIGELYGGSYYAAFTSYSEVMLHSARVFSARSVHRTLKDSNRRFPETMLSNSVYLYDADAGTFAKLDL